MVGYANMNVRIRIDILYPIRLIAMFSENVETTAVKDEPDFDRTGQSADPTQGSQVEHFSGTKLAEISHSKSPPRAPPNRKAQAYFPLGNI